MLSPEVIDLLAIRPGDRILDVRSGDGSVSRQLAALVSLGVVVGLDPDEELVRAARAAASDVDNVMYVTGTLEAIPWKEDYFSHAILTGKPGEMREVFRVLAVGGKLFLLNGEGSQSLLDGTGLVNVTVHGDGVVVGEKPLPDGTVFTRKRFL